MNHKTACLSKRGGRSINDDTAAIWQKRDCTWAYVGDGLGGYAGGKQASQTAAEALMQASRWNSLLNEEKMAAAVREADKAVVRLQAESGGNMKTTLVFLALEGSKARWMHIGDSRLYHFRGGFLQTQTVDHSVSQMAVLMGEITPQQIRFHEDRNRVLRALGAENTKPDISNTVMLTGGEDVFLLCTDGFWEYVYEEEMEQTLRQAKEPAQWLAQMEQILLSRVPANNDNYTAAAVFVE